MPKTLQDVSAKRSNIERQTAICCGGFYMFYILYFAFCCDLIKLPAQNYKQCPCNLTQSHCIPKICLAPDEPLLLLVIAQSKMPAEVAECKKVTEVTESIF